MESSLKKRIFELEKELEIKKNEVITLNDYLHKIQNSRFFRLASMYWNIKSRYLVPLLKSIGSFMLRVLPEEYVARLSQITKKIIKHGLDYDFEHHKRTYNLWIKKNEKGIWKRISLKHKPTISIVLPVYKTPTKILNKCIQSVVNQTYSNFKLIIVDDGSRSMRVKKILNRYAKNDSRIVVKTYDKNRGIANATNYGLKFVKSEFVGFLDHDDELAPNALQEIAKVINSKPNIDILYSDEDRISNDVRISPFFKPDWSPHTLLSFNYISHFLVVKRGLLNKVGFFNKKFDGSQDHDLILRITEKSNKIHHIPKVLYHQRITNSSTSNPSVINKPLAWRRGKSSLKETLKRRNIKGEVKFGNIRYSYKIEYEIIGKPLVSIIIPFRDNLFFLKKCINSIFKKTDYKNYEIILVNNNSKNQETINFLNRIKNQKKVKLLNFNQDFNFSLINNYATKHAQGDFVLFLNDDTEVINPGWLRSILGICQKREVGAVGCMLLYPNNTIQHAGVLINSFRVPAHAFKNFPESHPGYWNLLQVIRNCSAVTGACLMVSKDKFIQVGGFDSNLKVAWNDVDLCLRLMKKGYFNVYTPYAKLYHYESISRGSYGDSKEDMLEIRYFQNKWKKFLKSDPLFNPNLYREDFSFKY